MWDWKDLIKLACCAGRRNSADSLGSYLDLLIWDKATVAMFWTTTSTSTELHEIVGSLKTKVEQETTAPSTGNACKETSDILNWNCYGAIDFKMHRTLKLWLRFITPGQRRVGQAYRGHSQGQTDTAVTDCVTATELCALAMYCIQKTLSQTQTQNSCVPRW